MANFKLVCGDRYQEVLRHLLLECSMPSMKIHKGQKFILMDGLNVLGGARAILSEDNSSAIIASVCIRSRYRGTGAGAWMLQALHDELAFQGITEAYLGAVDSAFHFYKKNGYQTTDLEGIPEEFHKPLLKTQQEYTSSFYPYNISNFMHKSLANHI